jgi:hypothetical protein
MENKKNTTAKDGKVKDKNEKKEMELVRISNTIN